MNDIRNIDKNFEIKSKIEKDGISFYNIEDELFCIYGVFKENGKYRRMAEYIAQLEMKMLVYDYDYNAPNADFLRNTHEKMFEIIRSKNPTLPVTMLTTTPKLHYAGDNGERKQIVYQTYLNAVNSGDENVYFLDGSRVCDECADGPAGATVEGSHINDVGFAYLAASLGDLTEKIFKNERTNS